LTVWPPWSLTATLSRSWAGTTMSGATRTAWPSWWSSSPRRAC